MSKRLFIIRALGLLMALLAGSAPAAAQVEFKRGLEQISFIPKGQWITGVSVSFSQSDQGNYQFLIIENLTGDS